MTVGPTDQLIDCLKSDERNFDFLGTDKMIWINENNMSMESLKAEERSSIKYKGHSKKIIRMWNRE